jgi:hypothetical protein
MKTSAIVEAVIALVMTMASGRTGAEEKRMSTTAMRQCGNEAMRRKGPEVLGSWGPGALGRNVLGIGIEVLGTGKNRNDASRL